MARVQVQDLPDAPGLQPTVRSGGQYGVAVQQAGRNKLMDLADALSTVNPMLKDYAGIQRVQGAIGEQEAMKVSDADIYSSLKKTDKDLFDKFSGIERRNRAFNNTLIKRAVNNDLLPAMRAESDSLLDLDKYKDNASFLQGVDEFINRKWTDFAGQIGDEAATSEGAKAVWNTVTGPFKADMLAAYDKKKEEFIEFGQQDELGQQLDALLTVKTAKDENGNTIILPVDAVGLREVAEARERLMKEAGITDKQTRNRILVNEYASQVDGLIVNDRLQAAQTMLNEMYELKVNGNPIFKSGKAKPVINALVSKLSRAEDAKEREAEQDDEYTKAEVRTQFAGEWGTAFRGLRMGNDEIGGVISEATITTVNRIFDRLGVDEGKRDELIEQIMESDRPAETFDQMLEPLAQQGGESAMALFFGTEAKRQIVYEGITKREILPTTLSPEKKESIIEEYKTYVEEVDETATVDKWMDASGNNYRPWKQLIETETDLLRGNYVFKDDAYKNVDKHVKTEIEALTNPKALFLDGKTEENIELIGERFQLDASAYIQRRMREYGREIANDFEGDDAIKQRAQALTKFRNELVIEEKDRFKRIMTSLGTESRKARGDAMDETTRQNIEGADAEIDGSGWIDDDYESLVAADDNTPADRQTILKDRIKMMDRGDTAQLGRSLYTYGFPRFQQSAANMIKEAGLDADDVRLFGSSEELEITCDAWLEVLRKDLPGSREELTDDEKAIREEYAPYGIFFPEDLTQFRESQHTLMRMDNDRL
jgi:hypothetical protein